MTDNHRAEAKKMLAYAAEWAEEAGELNPRASELTCLSYAAVHALLAIHDTLTAADRYAANEAKQREEAFAPDATGTPSVTAPAADDPGDDAIDGQEGERRYLNAQTGLEPEQEGGGRD